MDIIAKKGVLINWSADIIVIGRFIDDEDSTGAFTDIDKATVGLIGKVITEEKYKAKKGSTLVVRLNSQLGYGRVMLVGLGKKKDFEQQVIREAAASAYTATKKIRASRVVVLPFGLSEQIKPTECAKAMTEGIRLSAYTFGRYKKEKKPTINSIEFLSNDGRVVRLLKKGIEAGELFARATIKSRDLVNTPALHMCPADLVTEAKEIAKGKKEIQVKVFDKEQLEKMGAGGILGVNQGSDHEPYLVHMIYKPVKKSKKSIALVGKAVTFDSGGLSLKPAEHMASMKIDMGGAADVIGVFSVLCELAPKHEIHGIFAAVENMPSGKAIRPGDVVQAMNKKTIEILNTDAEGRVTLADTLSYACKKKPDLIIDLATLTGACVVALGEEITGVMCDDDELAESILASAKKAGEKMWRLPLEKSYAELNKSDVADVKNIGGKYGGALTAGLFLKEFVDKKIPWAHLDIAGPIFAERPINAYEQKGATGHGVRTLLEFILSA